MKNFIKFEFLLTMLLSVTGPIVVAENSFAAAKKQVPPAPTEGTPALDRNHGTGSLTNQISIQSTQYLMTGNSYISKSGTVLTISGDTQAYSSVDTIAVDLYLQKWDAANSRWVDVVHAGEYQNYNASFVSASRGINSVAGYYYRTRAHHWVVKNGTVEQGDSVSSYVFVE